MILTFSLSYNMFRFLLQEAFY